MHECLCVHTPHHYSSTKTRSRAPHSSPTAAPPKDSNYACRVEDGRSRGGDAFVTEDTMRNACGLKPRPEDGGDTGLGALLGEERPEDAEAAWCGPQTRRR